MYSRPKFNQKVNCKLVDQYNKPGGTMYCTTMDGE